MTRTKTHFGGLSQGDKFYFLSDKTRKVHTAGKFRKIRRPGIGMQWMRSYGPALYSMASRAVIKVEETKK